MAQAAAELLEKQRRALRGAQEQQHVDEREIDALVVEVAGEQHVDLAIAQLLRRGVTELVGDPSVHGQRRDPRSREARRHVLGVLDADAEPEGADLAHVSHAAGELMADQIGASLVAGVQLAQRASVVAGAAPPHALEVHVVGDAEVLERHQQLAVEGAP